MQQFAELSEEQFPPTGYGISEVLLEQTYFPLARDFTEVPSFFRYYADFTLWDCWAVCDTGEPMVDFERGKKFADELVACARDNRCPGIIGHVVSVIASRASRKEISLGLVASSLLLEISRRAYVASHH